jgi:hypothetical protein
VASSYRDALSTVLDNVILLMLVPYRYLSLPFLPESIRNIGRAGGSFKKHMERISKDEFAALERGNEGAGSLITSLTKALKASQVKLDAVKLQNGLSVNEIDGNIFVINFAGHDTTASTLAFSMALLATSPEAQAWLAQEFVLSLLKPIVDGSIPASTHNSFGAVPFWQVSSISSSACN